MPRCSSRPSLIARGKRLGTRAVFLATLSGAAIGVAGASGHGTAAPSGLTARPVAASISPGSSPAGTAVPVALHVVVPAPGRPSVAGPAPGPLHWSGNGNGNGNGNGPVNGWRGQGNGNGNGNGNGDSQGNGGDGAPASTPAPVVPAPVVIPRWPIGNSGQPVPVATGNGNDNGNGQGDHNGQGNDQGNGDGNGQGNGDGSGQGQGHDHRGPGDSGRPVSIPGPVTVPTTATPPVTHTPSQQASVPVPAPVAVPVTPVAPVAPVTPVTSTPATTTPPVTVSPTPATTKKSTTGTGFSISGVVPVSTRHRKAASLATNPLLGNLGLGLNAPISQAAAALAHAGSQQGLSASEAAAAALANQQASAAAAAAKAAGKADGHKGHGSAQAASPSGVSAIPAETSKIVTQLVKVVPTAVWIALGVSLALAALGAFAAVWFGHRAHRQAGRIAEVAAAALTDPLTGVLNRRGFTEAVERELARAGRYERPFVLAYIDVRGLKRVNDTEGHLAGDTLLKAASAVLTRSVRAHDVVGRLGGDEFGLLLTEQSLAAAGQVTARIAEHVDAARDELGFSSQWDLTVGLAEFSADGTTLQELLAVADRRLYEQRGIALTSAR